MRDALLSDLSTLPYSISTTVDYRLNSPLHCDVAQLIDSEDNIWQIWEELIKAVDAVWFVAPETDGYLQRMTALAIKHQKCVIGSGLEAINIFGSKLLSAQLFKKNGLYTIDTDRFSTWIQQSASKWILKPDDGAGCDKTFVFDHADDLSAWIHRYDLLETHVIQPYIEGVPASISCLMHRGKALVLSCNQQLISCDTTELSYDGFVVNGVSEYWSFFEMIANKVAALCTDLNGYVGIDVIVTNDDIDEQCKIHLLEVNPRLTTCYIALNEAMGMNPAELIMDALLKDKDYWPKMQKNKISLEVKHG